MSQARRGKLDGAAWVICVDLGHMFFPDLDNCTAPPIRVLFLRLMQRGGSGSSYPSYASSCHAVNSGFASAASLKSSSHWLMTRLLCRRHDPHGWPGATGKNFCFVTFVLQPRPPLTGVSRALWAQNPERVSKESPGAFQPRGPKSVRNSLELSAPRHRIRNR